MLKFLKQIIPSKRRRLNQAGDTIVEVLIAIGVVGLMLTSAYAITNRSNRSLQDTQEHGQALKLVETQIELLRNNGSFPTGTICFKTSDGTPTSTVSACTLSPAGLPTTTQPAFSLSITHVDDADHPNVYAVKAVWDSVLSGQANVTIYYRY